MVRWRVYRHAQGQTLTGNGGEYRATPLHRSPIGSGQINGRDAGSTLPQVLQPGTVPVLLAVEDTDQSGVEDLLIIEEQQTAAATSGEGEAAAGGTMAVVNVALNSACAADVVIPLGIVDSDDLLAIINDWGCDDGPDLCPGDIAPPFGIVDVEDLLRVINYWGPCGPQS